jgi:hypothetical protein
VAALYEKGLVSHVAGADLSELEEQWTTWDRETSPRSPNNLDACVWAMWDLAGLAADEPKRRTDTAQGLGLTDGSGQCIGDRASHRQVDRVRRRRLDRQPIQPRH